MLFGAQEDVQDEFALGGAFETFLLDVFKKDFLLFGQWLCCGHCVRNFSIATRYREEKAGLVVKTGRAMFCVACRGGGMADAADLKSVVRKDVRVRLPPSAPA